MIEPIVAVIFGFILLVLGAQFLVRGGVGLARRLGVPPLIVGLTVVAYGTSTPELLVSLDAALSGSPGIAIGNAVGSTIFNSLMALGVIAVITPLLFDPRAIGRDLAVSILAVALFILAALAVGTIERWMAAPFIAVLLASVVVVYLQERKRWSPSADLHTREAEPYDRPADGMGFSVALLLGGVFMLVEGADRMVDGAVTIARSLGVSETVIGLTLVAFGTSLPELVTSIVAAFRRQADVALGNIIGSNTCNMLAILGVTAAIAPIPIEPAVIRVDMWVMALAVLLMVPPLLGGKDRAGGMMGRRYGAALLALYVAYIGYLGWTA